MTTIMETLPLLLMLPILVIGAYTDLRDLRIPNELSIFARTLFCCCALFIPIDEVLMRLLAAGLVFVTGFVLFILRFFGGGDVKLLTVLMLFIPSQSLMLYAYVFSASMLIGILLIVHLRKTPFQATETWASVQQANTFPMGISIAMSGIFHAVFLYWIV